jgi:magnesium transporter
MAKSEPSKRRDSMVPARPSSILPPRSSRLPNSSRPPSSRPPELGLGADVGEDDEDSPSLPARAVRTLERMTNTVGELGRLVGTTLGLPTRTEEDGEMHAVREPGAPAGIDHLPGRFEPPEPGEIRLRVIDICPNQVQTMWFEDVRDLLNAPQPEWVKLRWIDVYGLHTYVVSQIQNAFGFHTLAAEDVLHVPQRPRVDSYPDHVFVCARMFFQRNDQLISEQISMFMKQGLLVSFQEDLEDVWNPIRARLQLEGSKVRSGDASYLAYALLDAMVDHCFPILERYGEMLDHLEDSVLASTATNFLQEVHAIKRELTILRKSLWPMRDVIAALSAPDQLLVSDNTRTYLRDVYQHCVQIIDIVETFRELASSLTDLSLSMASNRMNEVMKVLTMISSVFIPITFLAGVYGMNFDYLPELHWRYSYEMFWVICLTCTTGLGWWFRRKGWW